MNTFLSVGSDRTSPRVEEMAQLVGMSRSAYSRKFRALCEESPSAALKREQLAHAEELLPQFDDLARLAYAAGYGSRRTLFRSFRRILDATPREIEGDTATPSTIAE